MAAKKAAPSVLENYLNDLGDAVKLTDEEKKDIQTYYLTDGVELKSILNDGSLSPLQQAQRVAEVRDRRDDKIGALLLDPARRREFFRIEAQYRVALTEAAADGALIPAAPSAPAPAPAAKS